MGIAAVAAVVLVSATLASATLVIGAPLAPEPGVMSAGVVGTAASSTTVEPVLKSVGVFGDPGYASSPAEEAALGKVETVAKRAGAIGYYRVDATNLIVRMRSRSPLVGTTETVAGFRLSFESSQFTAASRKATRDLATRVALSEPTEPINFIVDYDAKIDRITVSGQFGQPTVDRLNAIPGVKANAGGGMDLQVDHNFASLWSGQTR